MKWFCSMVSGKLSGGAHSDAAGLLTYLIGELNGIGGEMEWILFCPRFRISLSDLYKISSISPHFPHNLLILSFL